MTMRSRFLSRLPIDRNDAEARYEASGDVERDALDWLSGCTDIPGEVVDVVVDYYRRSRLYESKVDDIWEGVD